MLYLCLPAHLHELRNMFVQSGFDIRLVGGCVRDCLYNAEFDNVEYHDIDLCTDATPDEQKQIYIKHNIRHIDTGLQHGTWTIILEGQSYEITTLRTETHCDGRHAKVSWTKDWLLDLSRRDLTFNAMMMEFHGKVIDPYNGLDDLRNGSVRFVGDASQRIQEDYLRILRWFRFHGRFSHKINLSDVETCTTLQKNMHGLKNISRERVWSEFSKIISHENGLREIFQMIHYGIAPYIDLPVPNKDNNISFLRLEIAHKFTMDPISLMAAYLGSKEEVIKLAKNWKFSTRERNQAEFIAMFVSSNISPQKTEYWCKEQLAFKSQPRYWVCEALRVMEYYNLAAMMETWGIPSFPISGQDLLEIGFKTGPAMGNVLNNLRRIWQASDYVATKEVIIQQMMLTIDEELF